MELHEPLAWRLECRWKDRSHGDGWRLYVTYKALKDAKDAALQFANHGYLDVRIMPVYPLIDCSPPVCTS